MASLRGEVRSPEERPVEVDQSSLFRCLLNASLGRSSRRLIGRRSWGRLRTPWKDCGLSSGLSARTGREGSGWINGS